MQTFYEEYFSLVDSSVRFERLGTGNFLHPYNAENKATLSPLGHGSPRTFGYNPVYSVHTCLVHL